MDVTPSHCVMRFSSSHICFLSIVLSLVSLPTSLSPSSLPSSAEFTVEPDSAFFILIIIYFISSFFSFYSFLKNISSPSLPSLLLAINHSYLNILSDNSKTQMT